MRPTVATPVSPKRPDNADSLLYWQNKEASPFLEQARTALNAREITQTKLTTAATGALTTIFSEDLPFSGAWALDAHIIGRATAGGAARARYDLSGLFYREAGGVAVQEGATVTLVSISSVAFFGATLGVSGNGVVVKVVDDAVRTMSWSCVTIIGEAL